MPNHTSFNGAGPFIEAYRGCYDFNRTPIDKWTPETLLTSMEGFANDVWKGKRPDLDISFVNLFIDEFIGEQRQPNPQPNPQPRSTTKPRNRKRKEASPAVKRCKDAVGFSLDYPNVTPNAIPILFQLSKTAILLYIHMCGYMNTFLGETKPRSRKAWAALVGIKSKRGWHRLEKELIDSGLIQRHKDDKFGDYKRGQEIKFVLPFARSYRKMQYSDD